jgi:hypothetical protein
VIVLFGTMAVVLVTVALVSRRAAEKRKATMAGYAAHREWAFAPSDAGLPSRFHGAPFGQGGERAATNVLHGRHEGRHLVAFDYAYSTVGGRDESSHRRAFSVVALHLGVTAPDLSVGPTGPLGQLFNAITGRDIQIGHPAFDDRFTVTSHSPEFARDVLHPPVVELMLQHPDLAWRFAGDSMLMIRNGASTVPEIDAKLQLMSTLLTRVPPHVWTRLGVGPEQEFPR